jgi:hypothetical protein
MYRLRVLVAEDKGLKILQVSRPHVPYFHKNRQTLVSIKKYRKSANPNINVYFNSGDGQNSPLLMV